MPFEFLKYLQPTHYFRLFSKTDLSIFPEVLHLPEAVLNRLVPDLNYQTKIARDYDLSWQAVQKGYVGDAKRYSSFDAVSVADNYHFIRKYFHRAWVFYVLVLRLLSFHNPIKEIRAWSQTKRIKRTQAEINPIGHNKWRDFESDLLLQKPKVSVIIPTLNRYNYLKAVLSDFERQDYNNFEVVVVDQSEPFEEAFYKDFNLDIKLLRQEEKALWLARNTAIKSSKGTLIALSEDDVRIRSDWVSSHIKCLDFFDAQVSAGVFYPEGQQIPAARSFFTISSQFATGNAMLFKTVFEEVGLFDRQFEKQRMGDGEFGLRIYLEGLKSVSNPYASCIDVKAGTGGLREMGSWDAFRPTKLIAPRPIPSVLYFYRRYFGHKAAKYALLRTVPLSIFPYQFKKNKPMLILGVILSFLLVPIVLFQVFKSWRLSSRKLDEGPLIEQLS